MKKSGLLALLLTVGSLLFAADQVALTVYGYIKLDAIYETGSSEPGNFVSYAKDPGLSNGLFRLTANQTRVGLSIKGIGFGKFKVNGNVEIDFYGGNTENKPYDIMRKAYFELSNGTFTMIAGQTSDIISPLNPSSLNYSILWNCGNIGYRRPLLAVKNIFNAGAHVISMQVGLSRTIGDGLNGGIAIGFPTVQAALFDKFKSGGVEFELGISGHYGESKVDREKDYQSYSISGSMAIRLNKFKLTAELFTGENLATYMGGIAQSINNDREIHSTGFYFHANLKLSERNQLNMAYGQDDPRDEDLTSGARMKNSSIYLNLLHDFSKSIQAGLEVNYVHTAYKGFDNQKTFRFQHSWIFIF